MRGTRIQRRISVRHFVDTRIVSVFLREIRGEKRFGPPPDGRLVLDLSAGRKTLTRMRRYSSTLLTGLACVLGVAGMAGRADEPAPAAEASAAESAVTATPVVDWPKQRAETFELVWKTVNEAYFDPTFDGVDWAAVREKYLPRVEAAQDKAALRALLQAMLGELRRTHFSILPREMSVFTPQERSRVGTAGVTCVYVDGPMAISAVEENSPGCAAGLHRGDVILAIDGIELAPLLTRLEEAGVTPSRRGLYLEQFLESRLRGAVGSTVNLVVREAGGTERTVALTRADHPGEWSEPMGDFPSMPIQVEGVCSPAGIGYLHFNVFARKAMKDIRALLKAVPADGGLVIDLRGNGGGLTVMASGISGWLTDREFSLGAMHLREGHLEFSVNPQRGAFLGPIAVLIDSGSASTSEILAAGLQEAGRARLFGEVSAGAALPSLFKALPTSDLLQYAIADVQTPRGVTIEGRGVTPDETITTTLDDLVAGRDPVRTAAERWVNAERQRRAASQAATTAPAAETSGK
jgi:carboxyl-terminal processing protease